AGFANVHSAFAKQAEATPAEGDEGGPGLPPIPEGATVVAEGLWNPGNIVFGPDGTVSVLSDETGGIGIAVYEGEVYVAAGGTSVGMGLTPYPGENTVNAISIETGEVRLVAELGTYEADNNPDGSDVNPNLYGLDISNAGEIYVADAGGNTIYKIDAASGEYELFAVVPNLTDLTGANPNRRRGGDAARSTPGGAGQRRYRRWWFHQRRAPERRLGRTEHSCLRAGRHVQRRRLGPLDHREHCPRTRRTDVREPAHGRFQRRDAGPRQRLPDQRQRHARTGGRNLFFHTGLPSTPRATSTSPSTRSSRRQMPHWAR
ncbi:MAG: hypothetical protein M3457_19005, partial [Chloroflexota bacterium]|nr:hypothetical protein [Chloroflexota bacterium]